MNKKEQGNRTNKVWEEMAGKRDKSWHQAEQKATKENTDSREGCGLWQDRRQNTGQ